MVTTFLRALHTAPWTRRVTIAHTACLTQPKWLLLGVVPCFMWAGRTATSAARWICACDTPTVCLHVARQWAGTVRTLFRRIAMFTKPFRQVLCMVGSSLGAGLAATSTARWICTCGTPCACLCVARQRAGTVGTLFRCIAMLTKPFLQVFCMVGWSLGARLAATSTARWICTCGTLSACLCVARQGAGTVATFGRCITALTKPMRFLFGMVG